MRVGLWAESDHRNRHIRRTNPVSVEIRFGLLLYTIFIRITIPVLTGKLREKI